jgi:hypothetical protein
LIHPHWVVSSAHCLNYPHYGDTEVFANDFFAGVGLNGTPFAYKIVQLYSFARSRYEYTVGDTRTSDVVLIRLKGNVPTSVAVPAVLANTYPDDGALVTVFGYGCTDRNTMAAGSGKQYYSFNYGTATQALCPGDSGGPGFVGAHDGTGDLWGVNSDYAGSGSFATWDDIFGDIPAFKLGILDIIRENDGQLVTPGVDFPGGDYASSSVATPESCQALCAEDVACRAFTHVAHPDGSGTCYLKDMTRGWQPCAGCNAGIPTRYHWDTNRPGGDYASTTLPESRPELCFSACARQGACSAFTFVPAHENQPARCYLKNKVNASTSVSGLVSGVRRGLEADTDRPGADYGTTWTQDVDECTSVCAEDSRCRAFAFVPADLSPGGTCWLKSAVPDPVRVSGRTSGVKRGLERNLDRMGHDFYMFPVDGHKPEVCQSACALHPQCRAFTYVPTGIQGETARCWLKQYVGQGLVRENFISGIKGGEFF